MASFIKSGRVLTPVASFSPVLLLVAVPVLYGVNGKIEKAFEELTVNEVSCELKGVVSRKKQLIPAFMMALQNQ